MARQSRKYRDEDRSLDLYLKEIGETPLISADEEVRLAKKIHEGDHELVIFNGGERGGLICSSGICQNRPTFQGTRIVLFSRF